MRPLEALAGPPSSRILPAGWFAFITAWTLRRSCRSNDYTALLRIHASREFAGSRVDVGGVGLSELADVIAPLIRNTDLIGEVGDGGLGIVLSDADEIAGACVVQRLAEVLATVHFSTALTFALGVGACPTHGTSLAALLEHAESHPVLNVHAPLSADRLPDAPEDPTETSRTPPLPTAVVSNTMS